MRGEFSPFFGSNSAQILILQGPTTNGRAPHTRRDGIPHHEGRNPLPTWGLLPFYPKCQYLGHFSAKTRCQRRILHHWSSSRPVFHPLLAREQTITAVSWSAWQLTICQRLVAALREAIIVVNMLAIFFLRKKWCKYWQYFFYILQSSKV